MTATSLMEVVSIWETELNRRRIEQMKFLEGMEWSSMAKMTIRRGKKLMDEYCYDDKFDEVVDELRNLSNLLIRIVKLLESYKGEKE